MLNSQRVKVSKETVVLRRWGQFGYINILFAAVKVLNHLQESYKRLPLKTF